MSDVNLLLLDEPTNHLDIYSREQVEEALEEFDGTILAISHDRYFLDRIVDRIVEVRNPTLVEYAGSFSDYWAKRRRSPKAPRQKVRAKLEAEERFPGRGRRRGPGRKPGRRVPPPLKSSRRSTASRRTDSSWKRRSSRRTRTATTTGEKN